LLRAVSETNSSIGWRAIDKENGQCQNRQNREELYKFLCAEALNDIIPNRVGARIVIHLDKMASNKWVRESISAYLISRIVRDRIGLSSSNIEIEHQVSYNVPGLQVVDFIAGSVFQYLERGFPDYYRIIEKNVINGIQMD